MPFGLAKSEKHTKGEEDIEETREGSDDVPDSEEGIEDSDTAVANPLATGEQGEEAPYRAPTFRPAFLDEAASGQSAVAEAEAPPPEGDAFFVTVTKGDGVETYRFHDPAAAQTFVEELLEKDIPQKDVTVFSGHRLVLRVRHKPVVKLFGSEED